MNLSFLAASNSVKVETKKKLSGKTDALMDGFLCLDIHDFAKNGASQRWVFLMFDRLQASHVYPDIGNVHQKRQF